MIEPKHVRPAAITTSGGLVTYEYRFADGEGVLPHSHQYMHDVLILEGAIIVEIDGVQMLAAAGQNVTLAAGSSHGFIAVMPSVCRMIHRESDIDTYEAGVAKSTDELRALEAA
jgi:quercetin dioxygenase-like cupin family protein